MLALVLHILLRQFAAAAPDLCQPNASTPSSTLLLPLSPHSNIPMAEHDYSADVKNIARFEYLSKMERHQEGMGKRSQDQSKASGLGHRFWQ